MKRMFLAAVAVLALSLGIAPAALGAAPIDRFRDHFDITIEDYDACGFETTAHFVGQNFGRVTAGEDGLDEVVLGTIYRATFTSADGRQLVQDVRETSRDLVVTDNGDGTITETLSLTGTLFFRDTDNHVINQRAGKIIYSDTFDEDGNLVSFTYDIVGGPHPFAEGGIFCDSAEKVFG
jgi:hypothetical protein